MPTYEKRDADGTVLERTVTLPAGHPSGYDEQMAALAADESTSWHLVDDHQALAESTITAPVTVPPQTTPAGQPLTPDKTEEV